MPRKKMTEEEKKSKLTVRINELLLERLNALIEKNGDNRSQLIEKLLEKYIEENKNKL